MLDSSDGRNHGNCNSNIFSSAYHASFDSLLQKTLLSSLPCGEGSKK